VFDTNRVKPDLKIDNYSFPAWCCESLTQSLWLKWVAAWPTTMVKICLNIPNNIQQNNKKNKQKSAHRVTKISFPNELE